MAGQTRTGHNWMLDAGCWMSGVVFLFLLLGPLCLRAQTQPRVQAGSLIQLQVAAAGGGCLITGDGHGDVRSAGRAPRRKSLLPRDGGRDGVLNPVAGKNRLAAGIEIRPK